MLALHAIWTSEDRLALWAEDGSAGRLRASLDGR